jgi:hypothetical protein
MKRTAEEGSSLPGGIFMLGATGSISQVTLLELA